ncbi:hypothetical protein RZS08_16105, partial [Arthrospira platensis SPKY1]|nr:hypothetical protein [Arthrospira platensis SPKY1]
MVRGHDAVGRSDGRAERRHLKVVVDHPDGNVVVQHEDLGGQAVQADHHDFIALVQCVVDQG